MELQHALLEARAPGASLDTEPVSDESATPRTDVGVAWKVYAALALALTVFFVAVAAMASGLIPTPHT